MEKLVFIRLVPSLTDCEVNTGYKSKRVVSHYLNITALSNKQLISYKLCNIECVMTNLMHCIYCGLGSVWLALPFFIDQFFQHIWSLMFIEVIQFCLFLSRCINKLFRQQNRDQLNFPSHILIYSSVRFTREAMCYKILFKYICTEWNYSRKTFEGRLANVI